MIELNDMIKDTSQLSPKFTDEIAAWCSANCRSFWDVEAYMVPNARHMPTYRMGMWDGMAFKALFISERDATLFKVFWL